MENSFRALYTLLSQYAPQCEQEKNDKRLMLELLASHANALLRENETAHFTASSWITDVSRTQVLLEFHNIYQSWAWTGGHADGDADLAAVAVREAQEETGLQQVRLVQQAPLSLEILPVAGHQKHGVWVSSHLHYNVTFWLTADALAPLTTKPDENSGVRWFAIDEAVQASSEMDMRPIYEKLNARVRG